MMEPNRCALIQRADFADASGETPTRRGSFPREPRLLEARHIAPQNIRVHAKLGLCELRARLDLLDQARRRPTGLRIDGCVRHTHEESRAAPDHPPMRQAAVIAHLNRGRRQTRGIQIEDRLGLGLIALAGVVSLEHQKIGDAECRGREQLALQGDAISIAAGELQNGLDTVLQKHARGDRRLEMRAGTGAVGHVDRVGKSLERRGFGEQFREIARDRRRDFRGERELPRPENLLQSAHPAILTSSPA